MTFKEDVDLQIHKIEGDNGNLQEKKEAYIEKANRETKLNNRLLEMLQELRGVVPFRNPELFDEVESIEADTGGHLEDIPEPVQPLLITGAKASYFFEFRQAVVKGPVLIVPLCPLSQPVKPVIGQSHNRRL